MASRVQLYCDVNLTPIKGPNPLWTGANDKIHPQWIQQYPLYDSLISFGFRELFFIYEGTLNRGPIFLKDDGSVSDADHLDWSREGNFCNPPIESVVRRVSTLPAGIQGDWASNPQRMFPWVSKSQLHMPMCFDIENASMGLSVDSTDAEKRVMVQRYGDLVRWAKESAPFSKVGVYGFPPMANGDLLNSKARLDNYRSYHPMVKELAEPYLDFAMPSFYNWDLPAASPNTWFDQVEETTRLLDEFFPNLPRIATLTPTYQIYNPIYWSQVKQLSNVAIPLNVWTKQIQYLVDRDYDLCVWGGGTIPTPAVQILLAACAKFKY